MSETEFVDYYQLLGVPTHAEPEHIRQAFIKLAKEHHPDRGGSTEYMQQLTVAYRHLISTSKRQAYDLLHDFHTSGHTARYRDYGNIQGTSLNDLDDGAIDSFLDSIYAEYHNQPKPKTDLLTRIKRYFS